MGLGIPPLGIQILLESNPKKSIIVVRRLAIDLRREDLDIEIYIYIYIYMCRERDIERDTYNSIHMCIYIYIYIYTL